MNGTESRLAEHLKSLAVALDPASVHAFVAGNGRDFQREELTGEERKFVSLIPWKSRKPKQCYLNAQMEALTLPETPGITLMYTEGYVDPGMGACIDHAWLSVNGKVVDPTIRVQGEPGRIIGLFPEGWGYYGVEIEPSRCLISLERGRAVPLIDDWENGWPMIPGKSPRGSGLRGPGSGRNTPGAGRTAGRARRGRSAGSDERTHSAA